jgi:hypothetical protein
MVPEEWPISSPAADEPVSLARVAGGDRLSTVTADFFLDPAKRLTEQERALIGSLLDDLIGWIADQVRSAIPQHYAPANDADGHALREILCSAGLLQRRDLMAVLLRSADEERIASAMRVRFPSSPKLLQRLISSPDADVSAAAMELILARGRRRNRYGQPRLDFDDLPERVAGGLVHAVAAALRSRAVASPDRDADRELSKAADALLRARDPDKAIDGLSRRFVETLAKAGLLDEAVLDAAMREGDIRMVAHGLAFRASIEVGSAWELMTGGADDGTPLLLRMAGASRTFAAQFIAAIGDQLGIADPAHAIRAFDSLEADRIVATAAWMQLEPSYRTAANRLTDHG